jgi:hypothetical protein
MSLRRHAAEYSRMRQPAVSLSMVLEPAELAKEALTPEGLFSKSDRIFSRSACLCRKDRRHLTRTQELWLDLYRSLT